MPTYVAIGSEVWEARDSGGAARFGTAMSYVTLAQCSANIAWPLARVVIGPES